MIRLEIEGMSCGHCVKAVKEALSAVPGVEGEVHVKLGEAVVGGTPDPAALLAAVAEEGFSGREV